MRKTPKAQLHRIPTAAGGIARAAFARAERMQFDTELLLKKAGLTVQQAKDPSIRIGVKNQIRLLNLVADALQDRFLGVRLAQELDLRELGLLFYVPASSDTLGEALQNLARYSSIFNEGVRITYREGAAVSITFEYADVLRRDDCHQIEFFVATLLRVCRQLTGRNLVPHSVKFIHHRAESMPGEFVTLFGDAVAYGDTVDEVTYPSSVACIRLASADPYLHSLLLRYCNEAIASRRVKSSAWRTKVENAIASLLPNGQAQMSEVARQLAVSERTLARRLEAEGLTFVRVLDSLRCDLAKRYLQEEDLQIAKIAWLLGYKEASAFNHAFKRWTGKTPRAALRSAA
jgi:AraC-like DNA-binding protein